MFCFKLAQYDETNGLSFRKTTEITDDVKQALKKLQPGMLKTTTSVEGLAKSLGTTDQGFIKFCQSVKDGDIQIQQGQTYLQAYQAELKKTEFSFKTIATAAKGFFKNLGGKLVSCLINAGIGIADISSLIPTKHYKATNVLSSFFVSNIHTFPESLTKLLIFEISCIVYFEKSSGYCFMFLHKIFAHV